VADEVLTEQRGATRLITLNRPERLNAINEALVVGLRDALVAANADDGTHVIVLRGSGRAFCSGEDLEDTLERLGDEPNEATIKAYSQTLQDVTRRIVQSNKFVVGAIHGWAVGAGFEWAVNCDFPIWAEGARGFFPEMRWGLFPTGGVTALLPAIVGLTKARELLLLGEKHTAEELLELGVAWRVVAESVLLDEAEAVADKIAALPQRAVRDLKRTINRVCLDGLEGALEAEIEGVTDSVMDPDTWELIREFEQKNRST